MLPAACRAFLSLVALSFLFLSLRFTSSQEKPNSGVESRSHELKVRLGEEWQYELRTSPEFATSIGDSRYNDKLSDNSPDFFRSDVEQKRKFLAGIEAIDPSGFSEQDRLTRDLMIRQLRQEIEGAKFEHWEMPVNQMGGPHLELPDLVTLTPFKSVKDYEDYISRLHKIPHLFDQTTANMRQGMADHLMPPRFLLEKVPPEVDDIANEKGESSPFAKPLNEFPSTISAAERKPLSTAILSAINDEVIPAYRKFSSFVRNDYAPHGRAEPGVWALPDGEARYRFAVRRMTTTDLSPDEIHEIGLKELHQTETQMLALANKFGFKDLASFNEHIKNDRKLYATSGQQLLDLYAKYVRDMEPNLPQLFGRLPKAKLVAI